VPKTFNSVNFGCRVNAAETNQLSQQLVDHGYVFDDQNPDTVIINTCAITKKGEYESLSKIETIQKKYPHAKILVTGCADFSKIKNLKNVEIIPKNKISTSYTPQIKDKFSHTNRYLLKVQSGCTVNCTFCIVPSRRPTLDFLPIDDAVKIINSSENYQEVIITGVNLTQYTPGLSNLVEALLTRTSIKLISFGSVPLLCVDDKFIKLLENPRVSHFLHIPLQSGSNKVLKLMHRPYDVKKIKETFTKLKSISGLTFGTDIIVGFPTETESDFQNTYGLCQQIGFFKIHVFKYSPRPGTQARELFLKSEKISKTILSERSKKLRNLVL